MKKVLSLAAFLLAFAASSFAQSAEEVITKHIAATGGAEAWAKLNNMKMDAKITADGAPNMVILMSMTTVRDKAARTDVTVMGMTQSAAFSGDKGWSNNPFMGKGDAEPMTADQVKAMKDMADIDGTLVGYKEKGYKVEYIGTEDVDGTDAIKIKVDKGDKRYQYSFFDPATYYEIKSISVEEVDGKQVESATLYSNFQKQDGVLMPFTLQQNNPMMGNSTITVTGVSFNGTVDEKIFEMPAKK
ncbi:MAG TPA: hypothetical protein PK971_02560 [Saprospiraceae bacterium]|nr:hypothetical protein [Saprospiraceae bacterium]HND87179.1 hypothetical protein [Saprospiraceae bacterium]